MVGGDIETCGKAGPVPGLCNVNEAGREGHLLTHLERPLFT